MGNLCQFFSYMVLHICKQFRDVISCICVILYLHSFYLCIWDLGTSIWITWNKTFRGFRSKVDSNRGGSICIFCDKASWGTSKCVGGTISILITSANFEVLFMYFLLLYNSRYFQVLLGFLSNLGQFYVVLETLRYF